MNKGDGGKNCKPKQEAGSLLEKLRGSKGNLKRLAQYLKPFKGCLTIVCLCVAFSTAFSVAAPKITGIAFNMLGDGYVSKMAIQQAANIQKTAASVQAGLKDPKELQALENIKALPLISEVRDPEQKACIFKALVELGEAVPGIRQDISYTPEQKYNAFRAIRETNGTIDFINIGRVILSLFAIYLLSALFTFCTQYLMSGISQKFVYSVRRDLDEKLSRLPLNYFDTRTQGEILSRMTNDVDTISATLQQSFIQIVTSAIQITGYTIVMLAVSPVLALIVLAAIPFYILLTKVITGKSKKYFAVQQKEIGQLSGHAAEMYTGHIAVKAYGHEKESVEKFKDINDRLYEAGWKAQFVSGILSPLIGFTGSFAYAAICVAGGLLITANKLMLGDITAFIQYSRAFTNPVIQLANTANIIQAAIVCAERVFEVLDETEEIKDTAAAKALNFTKGEVKIENLAFSYREDVPLIENMNMDVKQGHTIAIVGPTGAGKTTLVNLLMRFYETKGGRISIDGVDIRDFKRSELRSMFGMVLQETWLFSGTIRENIAYGRDGASEEAIILAAEAAGADHFIRALPEGYDTVLNEEASNISQGQKQLITIARAILADPAILILDEATSCVDTKTEALIQKDMAMLRKNRTSFVIAHRLSTIRDAEMIIVMDKGHIVEQGCHKELLAKGGFYAELYNSQFAG